MERGKELLLQAVSTILFCIAITLLLHQKVAYKKLLKKIQIQYNRTEAIYSGEYQGNDQISYAELIISLCNPLTYDLEIDGYLISHADHTADQISHYPIEPGANYHRSYAYDQNGRVTRIIYDKVL